MALLEFDGERLLAQRTGSPGDVFRLVPVRIKIAGVDLLGYVEETEDEPDSFRWALLTITDVARWGLNSLRQAKQTGMYSYALDESGSALLFKMADGDILVHSTMVEKTVQVPYQKLETAWMLFADRVREFVRREFPTLKEEPAGWGEWLEGKDDTTWSLEAHWESWFEEHDHHFDHIDAIET